jgi:glycerol-3-phosphate acyltransferase PlsY
MISHWQVPFMMLGAYLLGSIPFGLMVSRLKGVDIRKHGSGNLGATNVGRGLGRRWGILVLLLDAMKGATSSIGTSVFLNHENFVSGSLDPTTRDLIWLGTGVCCVIGSIAPVYLRFRGGKGVAATLGVILGIYPYLTLPAVVSITLWAMVLGITRYVSLSSIIAVAILPLAFLVFSWRENWPLNQHYPLLCLTVAMTFVIVFRHRGNIRRLLAGTENKVGNAGNA